MRVDGKVFAVNSQWNLDGTFTAVTQQDGNFLAVDGFLFFDGTFFEVDGNSNFDGKSPLYRDRPPVRYLYVGKFAEHLPIISDPYMKTEWWSARTQKQKNQFRPRPKNKSISMPIWNTSISVSQSKTKLKSTRSLKSSQCWSPLYYQVYYVQCPHTEAEIISIQTVKGGLSDRYTQSKSIPISTLESRQLLSNALQWSQFRPLTQ